MNNFETWEEYQQWKKTEDLKQFCITVFIALGLLLLCLFVCKDDAHAQLKPAKKIFTYGDLANAIYYAEGGKNTNYPYGIKSVSCDTPEECRKICINTIRNNIKRWKKAKDNGDSRTYLRFLADRYCPPKAHHLNKNWLKNVKFFLNNPKEVNHG